MSDLLKKFFIHLEASGILKADDSDKLMQIYSEIDESDIMFEGHQTDDQPDQTEELRIVFSLADLLKMQANDSENGLFDIAQTIFQ